MRVRVYKSLVERCMSANTPASSRTIEGLLKANGVQKQVRCKDTPELRIRIAFLYFEEALPEDALLETLREETYNIGARALARIRLKMGIKRKYSIEEYSERHEAYRTIVQRELDKVTARNCSRNLLYAHFKTQQSLQLNLSRDRLYELVRELDPMGVYNRARDVQRRRGEYIVPGPDFVWSIDAHCKLEPYGIQIYAAIDAYSRQILWLYVGISARTLVSVYAQFITAVQQRGAIVRSVPRGFLALALRINVWKRGGSN
ncbi:hypothetical protein LTR95_012391 [Oleoguttula sp. CCFEE 5521]